MTSNLSSAKQFQTSFLQALKRYCFHGILMFALLLPIFNDIYHMFREQERFLTGYSDYDYLADYVFALNRHIGNEEMGYLCLVVGFSAMFLALHCWRYLHVKKTLNVYCSLGVSRSTQFWARFLACALLLIAPIVIVFAGLLFFNIVLFGSSAQLWTATAVYALSLIAVTMVAYCLTSISMCVTGASVESFLCAGCLVALPVTFFYNLQYLAAVLLKGNAVDRRLNDIVTGDSVHEGAFLPDHSFLDFFRPVTDYDFSRGFEWNRSTDWSHPGWKYPLLWLAVAAVLSAILFVLFKNRKNENAGFLGKNPVLIAVACLSLSFLISIPAYFVGVQESITGYIVSIIGPILLFLVYITIMAILLRSKKKLARTLPIALAACIVFESVCVLFISGAFGYEKRIPKKEDIESVGVSCGRYVEFSDYGDTFYKMYTDAYYMDEVMSEPSVERFFADSLSYFYPSNMEMVCGLTDEKDIDAVLSMHQSMIDAKESELNLFDIPVAFQYKLKNGKTITRYYPTATHEVMDKISAYETHDAVRQRLANTFNGRWIDNVVLVAPAASQVTLLPNQMIYDGFDADITRALKQDTLDGTLPVCGFGDKAPIGYISLSGYLQVYNEEYGYDKYYYDSSEHTTVMPAYDEDMTWEETPGDVREDTAFTETTTAAAQDVPEESTTYGAPVVYDREDVVAEPVAMVNDAPPPPEYNTTYAYVLNDHKTEMVYTAPAIAYEDTFEITEPMTYILIQTEEEFEVFEIGECIPVYPEMENTLAVLEEYDLMQYFTGGELPVAAKLVRTPFANKKTKADKPADVYLNGDIFHATYTYPYSEDKVSLLDIMPDGNYTQDKDVIAGLVANSFFRHFASRDGCIVAFEYADGNAVQCYVPIEFVPENLR